MNLSLKFVPKVPINNIPALVPVFETQVKLERLRSEDTPRRLYDYPHYWVMLDPPKSKQGHRMTLKI